MNALVDLWLVEVVARTLSCAIRRLRWLQRGVALRPYSGKLDLQLADTINVDVLNGIIRLEMYTYEDVDEP